MWIAQAVVKLKVVEAELYALVSATLKHEMTGTVGRVRLGIER